MWYLLYVKPADQDKLPDFPLPGTQVVHKLNEEDHKDNSLWSRIQDGVRPAWAPDLLRLGYAIVFKRGSLVPIFIALDVQSPDKAKKKFGRKRTLTFEDVWVIQVNPQRRPFVCPPSCLTDEEWWLSTKNRANTLSAWVCPGGVVTMEGAKRLADLIREQMATPEGYPRHIPGLDNNVDYYEVLNPLIPKMPTTIGQGITQTTTESGTRGYGYDSFRLFRW